MSTSKTALRDARLAALLRKAANELDPQVTTTTTKAAKAAKVKTVPPVAVPTTGGNACLGCGKALLTNVMCRACRAKAGTENAPVTPKAKTPKVAVINTPTAPAKVDSRGRRDAKAHCRETGCGLFVRAGAKFCTKHTVSVATVTNTKAAKVKAAKADTFITLDDGKRGYRVPADLAIRLRKADLTDAQIIAAAKAQGVGAKVAKTAGVL